MAAPNCRRIGMETPERCNLDLVGSRRSERFRLEADLLVLKVYSILYVMVTYCQLLL